MDIALAIIVDQSRSRILIGQRPAGTHLEGYWEFPGGKVEPGETPIACASREALEETEHDVHIVEAWPVIRYEYPERTVELYPFLCEAEPFEARYGRFLWVHISDLADYIFPAANAPLLERLSAM